MSQTGKPKRYRMHFECPAGMGGIRALVVTLDAACQEFAVANASIHLAAVMGPGWQFCGFTKKAN